MLYKGLRILGLIRLDLNSSLGYFRLFAGITVEANWQPKVLLIRYLPENVFKRLIDLLHRKH